MGPFTGQNLGARNLDRLESGINLSQRFSFLWGLLMMGVVILLRRPIAGLFSEDPKVIEALVLYLSIAPIGYAFRCLYALDNTLLNVMDRPFTASGITITQMFGLYLPGAYLGAELFGLAGVFGAIPLTFLGGGLASLWFVQRQIKQLKQQEDQLRSQEQVPEVA
jgi:Na+-driven multidrug efflux pump